MTEELPGSWRAAEQVQRLCIRCVGAPHGPVLRMMPKGGSRIGFQDDEVCKKRSNHEHIG